MKKKVAVIMVSTHFMKGHPREGEKTLFREWILDGVKKHTIRHNIDHWRRIEKQVNSGESVLSVRYWLDEHYNSRQIELVRLEKIGVQEISITPDFDFYIDGRLFQSPEREAVMRNDGLQAEDFKAWFPMGTEHQGVIVHFTDLRY